MSRGPGCLGGIQQNEPTKIPLVWWPLTVPCPRAPGGLATPVFCFVVVINKILSFKTLAWCAVVQASGQKKRKKKKKKKKKKKEKKKRKKEKKESCTSVVRDV